ncbi:MAG: serine hydrolase domain-containing protein, partial [Chitinophagaceae bacterium]
MLAAHKKKLIYQKSFGYTTAQKQVLTNLNNLYDLASITKTAATTLAIMKLYEGRKLSLTDTLGKWFPLFNGTSKAGITVKELLTHEGGLVPFIPFYKYFQSKTTNDLDTTYFSNQFSVDFSLPVSNNLFAAKAVLPIIDSLMLTSKTTSKGIYVYSDMDFILLGRIVEQIAGKSLDEYVKETFYNPLQLASLTFRPATDFVMEAIVPTENDLLFRNQLIHGYVHDEGAALMGGIAGHAGLFGNAYDLAYLYQLLLNNGNNGLIQILQPATIQLFTSYAGTNSRRGLGFDKPEKNNAFDKNPYPCFSASTTSFGHTGFTGTCVWADPENELVFV